MHDAAMTQAMTLLDNCPALHARRVARWVTECHDKALAGLADKHAGPSTLQAMNKRRMAPKARTLELQINQLHVLALLRVRGGMRMSDVAKHFWLDLSTMTRNVDRLEEFGWVKSTSPGRERMLSLSQIGQDLVDAALPHWEEAQACAHEQLGESLIQALADVNPKLFQSR
jgi:DNA-binding MarR family transcriptional regulator